MYSSLQIRALHHFATRGSLGSFIDLKIKPLDLVKVEFSFTPENTEPYSPGLLIALTMIHESFWDERNHTTTETVCHFLNFIAQGLAK